MSQKLEICPCPIALPFFFFFKWYKSNGDLLREFLICSLTVLVSVILDAQTLPGRVSWHSSWQRALECHSCPRNLSAWSTGIAGGDRGRESGEC